MSNERSGFSSRLGFVLATAGSAVGLGNIWRFPYLAAKYGGGTFLLTYLILTLTFGFSLMITEVALGRKAGTSAIRAFGHFSKKHTFIGYLTTIIPFIIFPYYCVIGGWVTKYALISLQGGIHNAASDTFFTGFISKSAEPMICVLVFLIATTVVVAGGVIFGALTGALLSLFAATLGSSLSFLIARFFCRDVLISRLGHTKSFRAIERGIARNGIDFLILTRLVPLFPYNIQSYLYGLTPIAFWPFTFISALSMLPGVALYSFMAAELAREGISQQFMMELCLSGFLLFTLIQIAKAYGRYKQINLQQLNNQDI